MLEQFRESQPRFVEQITKIMTDTQKISHAYLIETNSFPQSEELVFAFAKILLCPEKAQHKKNEECKVCHLVDERSYCDFQIIRPDGSWIKKEQLLALQTAFKTKSMNGGRRVYIIFQAEKLNVSSANTLLKFLEEPEDGIVAILVTSNRYQVIETILSRCQIISLLRGERMDGDNETTRKQLLQFLTHIYIDGPETIAYMNHLWYDFYKDKEETINALKQLELICIDLLENQKEPTILMQKYGQAIEKILEKATIHDIIKKLKVIDIYKQKLQYNVNFKLCMDDFVISLCKGGE